MPKPTKKEPKSTVTSTSTAASGGNEKAGSPKKQTVAAKGNSKSTTTKLHTVSDSLDVILPLSLGKSNGECMVLVQIDPDDSAALDFEGSTGVIGRFQVDKQGIILDMKGSQYQGRILPGPTAMVASLCYDEQHKQQLRLETITDEFCPLVKTQDTMAKLDAQVLKGTLDESYQLQEEDINITAKKQEQLLEQQAKKQQKNASKTANNTSSATNGGKKQPKKRAAPKGAASSKKQKVSTGKGKK